jgi:hypothetical protein
MSPIEFPEQTVVWAKNQPPFLPLPAWTNERETISLWKLTWRERIALLFTGRLWHRQMNFGHKLQGVSMSVETPFIVTPTTGKEAA